MTKRIVTFSPKQVKEKNFETYPFQGKYKELIGCPEVRFTGIVFGASQAGKSTLLLEFAEYLSTFGKCVYVASEEKISQSLKVRLSRLDITNDKLRFVAINDKESIETLIQRQRPRFIIIDSAQVIGLSYADFQALRNKYYRRKLSWIIVLQSTHAGQYIGPTSWRHDTNFSIQLKNGVAYSHGHYAPPARMQVLSNVQQSLFNQ